jgi:pyruvate carboxylase subunit A
VIKKILIANRGEIAVRIIRACAEAGITSVAIYADADRHALHVKKADEAHNIGPESIAGYLNAHRIVNLAVATGCDALHPGYGFLSENPLLAEICQQRQVRFIGPDADVIRRMGNKVEARRAMQAAGIPVVPGSDGNLGSLEEAVALAENIGYPVMLKAITTASCQKRPRRSDRQTYSWKNVSIARGISRSRSWLTGMATPCTCLSVIARYNAVTRS